jgi:peptidoglycan/LPS O-acetylase OafA/YrhL
VIEGGGDRSADGATAAPALAPGGAARPGRRADVDWLRVIAMAVVFTIHVAEPFNPWDEWHIVSPVRSKWLGEVVFFLAPWIMPLFMVLAGDSAWRALARRSSAEYLRERFLRIGLPLVAGLLVLVPPQVYLERRLRGQFHGSLVDFYPRFFDGIYPQGNLSWHHLWFLVVLLAFALVTLPLFQWLRGGGRTAMARLAPAADRAWQLPWLLLPVIAIRVATGLLFAGVPALAYDWSNRGLLLPAFVCGFVLAGQPDVQRAVERQASRALALALAASAALCAWAWPGDVLARLPSPRSAAGVLLWAVYGCAAWCWVIALLGGARRHLGRRSGGLERASEMVYPFYVLHHGFIVAAAFLVVQWQAGIALSFLVLAAVSLAATIALCAAVTSSGALRLLFGLRRRPPAVTGSGG